MRISIFLVSSFLCTLHAKSNDGEPEFESQSYQIRSKIKLKPVQGLNLDGVKDGVEIDIKYLFCDDPRLVIAEAQECQLAHADYESVVIDENGLSGDVQFLVQVSVPQTWTKNDLKGHYDEEVKQLSTTISTTTTTVSTTNGDGNSETTTTTTAFTAESTTEADITTEPAIETTTKPVMETTTAATTTNTTPSTTATTIASTTNTTATESTTTTTPVSTTATRKTLLTRTTTTASTTTTTTTPSSTTTTTAWTTTATKTESTTTTTLVSTTATRKTLLTRRTTTASTDLDGEKLGLVEFVAKDDQHTYEYIDVSTLHPESFVVCVGECKAEGFWMMIGFVSLSCLCLFLSGISFCCSSRVRSATAAASSALLLGYIGGLIYVGVTQKVAWNFTGGYLGTVNH